MRGPLSSPVSRGIEMDQRQDHLPTAEAPLDDGRLTAQLGRVKENSVGTLQVAPADARAVRHIDIGAEGLRLRLSIPGQYADVRIRDQKLRRPPGGKDGRLYVLPDSMLAAGKADGAAETGNPFPWGLSADRQDCQPVLGRQS